MAAGLATLRQLSPERYAALEAWAAELAGRLEASIRAVGRDASIARVGPLLTLFFRSTAPVDGAEALESDRDAYARFFGAMLDAGVLLPPSQFEAWFPGFAHGERELDAVAAAADRALRA
jgi:glutamate-1-semialdehyde 2,1-aminomutase